ncbi:hypothetical protein Tco_1053096 [Tanacetum coccineum]
MKESKAYKTYYDLATRMVALKPKYVRRSTRIKTDQAPQDAPGKRLKATSKVAKSGKKKQPAQELETLSEIALSEAEQMKITMERSKTQLYSSHASGSGADEGTGVSPGVPDVPIDGSEDEQISWKSSDEDDDEEVSISKDDDDDADDQEYDGQDDEGQDDVNEQTESDNDGDDFVHPKFSTHDQEERQDEEDKQEEGSDLRVQTPSHYESTNDEESDEVTQGTNVQGEEMDEEETNEEEETNVQGTQVTEDTHVIITAATPEVQQYSSSVSSGFISNMLNPNPDTSIESILNLNTESTTLVDVLVTSNAEMPPSSATTHPPPPIPPIQPLQQTPVPTPTIVPNRLRDEAQADNEDFINKLDDNIKKIIKEHVKAQVKEQVTKILPRIEKTVNEQLEAEVLTRSSNEAKTSHVVAANLSELELKKILIDKMESNKSIHRSNQQKTLYKALVDAYESDKLILDTYGDIITIKRCRDDPDEDEEPFAGSNWGSKRRRAGKEPESTSAPKEKTSKSKSYTTSTGKFAQAEEPIHANEDLEEPTHQEFDTRFTEDQHTLLAAHGPIQPWINNRAQKEDTRDSFNELMDTPLDFSAFVMNQLKVDTLTPELLAGPTFELMKRSCKSLVELEYFLEGHVYLQEKLSKIL